MELNNATYLHSATSTRKPLSQAWDDSTTNQAHESDAISRSAGTDTVEISDEGKNADSNKATSPAQSQSSNNEALSQEEIAKLTKLKARDVEVRAHEQAHLSAAGGFATGGASFSYQKGPDGQSYAVGGEVGIDLSEESDPNATIQKMQTIKRAALAPASPSSTDRQVAAQAEVKESLARQEVLQEQQQQLLHASEGSVTSPEPKETQSTTNNNVSGSISSLKASISAYEQMAAM